MRTATAWGLCLVLLAAALPVSAATVLALDLEELVRRAERVALARALREEVLYDEDGLIVTDVLVRVEDSLKGSAALGEELWVRTLGGTIGDTGMHVPGEPRLRAGDRAVLFLRSLSGGPEYRPVGMSQGVMPVRIEQGRELVLPGGAELGLVRYEQGRLVASSSAALREPAPLQAFLDQLRQLALTAPAPAR